MGINTYWVDKPDAFLKEIIARTFSGYTGKKIQISNAIPSELRSYWDGGSKTSYCFYNLSTRESQWVETNHPFFEADKPCHLEELPKGFVIVSHSFFCGKDMGITIYVNEEDMTKMIEAPEEVSLDEEIVLEATSSLKSSYGGVKNLRFVEANRYTGISEEEWNVAKMSLIQKKFLNKAGAITPKGRNAIAGRKDLYRLGQERRS
jgi:hypothetical protein